MLFLTLSCPDLNESIPKEDHIADLAAVTQVDEATLMSYP